MATTEQDLFKSFGRLMQHRRFVGMAMRSHMQAGEQPQHRRGPGRLLRLLTTKDDWTNADIAEALDIRPSSVSAMVSRLEEEGLVTRHDSTDDKRVSLISLTAEGRQRIADFKAQRETFRTQSFASLNEDEQAQLNALLAKVADGLDQTDPVSPDEDRPRPGFGGPGGWGGHPHGDGPRRGWGGFGPRW